MRGNPYPTKWSSNDLLKAVEQLPPQEAEELYVRLRNMRSRRQGSGLPAKEAALLTKINRGFSEAWWDNYDQLVEKRCLGTLTKDEHRELLRLTDQLEKREAARLGALVQLAEVRKRSLRGLIKELGLPARIHA